MSKTEFFPLILDEVQDFVLQKIFPVLNVNITGR